MPTKRQRRKRRKRLASDEGRSSGSPARVASPPATEPSRPSTRRGSASLSARRRTDDRPSAPWGDFPLSEIAVLVGVVLLIAGFFVSPPQGFVMIAVGLVLGSLAGLELSIREHFAGYRSHTLLLSAAVGVPVFGVLFVATEVPVPICLAAGAVAFGGSAWLFTQAFRRRSGGALFRLRD
jgi:hypothetical protein